MAGFGGRILFEGDTEEAQALIGDAIKLADTLRAWKTTQGMRNVTKVYNLRDGGYVVVSDLQHMRAMQIVAPATSEPRLAATEVDTAYSENVGVKDVLSGIVVSGLLRKETISVANDEGVVEDVEVDAVTNFIPTSSTSSRYTDLERRRILGFEEDQTWRPFNLPPEVTYSVHSHVKPSQFSGAMRKVVQLLLGVGSNLTPTWEQRWAQDNKRVLLDGAVRSPYGLYNRIDTPPRKLKFDYRFAKTHGIAFDKANKPWVIEISWRGVLAMPLYLDPVSTLSQGRDRYLEVSPELEEFFDEFGGMPLGVEIPTGSAFNKWKKAGEIVVLLDDVSAFYSKSAFSPDIGWSFNSRGTEAHNCATGVENDLSTGAHYKIKISLEQENLPALSGARATLAGFFNELYQINKCKRMDESAAKGLLETLEDAGEQAMREAFEDLTVAPTMQGTAELTLVRKGILYNPAKPRAQPQIKFPNFMLNGNVSFDFGPYSNEARGRVTRCDAPMFVCHIDDAVEVVNYFWDGRPRPTPGAENTREECQFTGTWTNTVYGGEPYIAGNFYSSRWDWRQEITPDDTVTKSTGRKIAVQGFASADHFFSICVGVGSTTVFSVKFESTVRQGRGRRISVAVPFHTRDCYYMAEHSYITSKTSYKGAILEAAPGPQVQGWRLYNFIFHWVGQCGHTPNLDPGSVRCIAKKFYEGTQPSCVEDKIPGGGIQYSVCPESVYAGTLITVNAPLWNNAILGSAIFPQLEFPTTWSEFIDDGIGEQSYEIRAIADNGMGEIVCEKGKVTGKNEFDEPVSFFDLSMSDWWWRFSPDPDSGSMPWMGMTQSCLGNTIANFHPDLDAMTVKHQGSPSTMYAGPYGCYTGVIR